MPLAGGGALRHWPSFRGSTGKARKLLLFGAVVLAALALAQGAGSWVNRAMPIGETVELTRFVHLTHVRNYGGIFGLLPGRGWLFSLFAAGLLTGIACYLVMGKGIRGYEYACWGFIVGGGASNILDRLLHGSVIDYIDIQHIPAWHYVFNVADVLIHLGVWPLVALSLRGQSGSLGEEP